MSQNRSKHSVMLAPVPLTLPAAAVAAGVMLFLARCLASLCVCHHQGSWHSAGRWPPDCHCVWCGATHQQTHLRAASEKQVGCYATCQLSKYLHHCHVLYCQVGWMDYRADYRAVGQSCFTHMRLQHCWALMRVGWCLLQVHTRSG